MMQFSVVKVAWRLLVAGFLLAAHQAEAAGGEEFKPSELNYWAFARVRRPESPIVRDGNWVRNPIDSFVLAELESKNLHPSRPTDNITLLRRATLDLTGLPPTPEEVDAFVTDKSPNAFEKVVDRLLASPHYGEYWARHWLDLARYAESEGFKEDETRPNVWRYRDYVIKSFNLDKPYDRFLREQIAGDELWPDDPDALVATAFNRHYPDEHNARDLRQRRQEILNDVTDTVGAVFAGMTFACARCHNHKFDAVRQSDYYRLQAFFANAAADDGIILAPQPVKTRYRQQLALWEEKTRTVRAEMQAIEEPKRQEIVRDLVEKYPQEVQDAIAKPAAERTPFECLMYAKARQYIDPNSYLYVAPTSAVVGKFKAEEKKHWQELKTKLDKFKDLHPHDLPTGAGIRDIGPEAVKTYVLNRGVYDKPREEVEPGFLQVLDPRPAQIVHPPGLPSTGRRAALANLLASADNPLTARVMVNRLWHYHFGRGIVATPSDFGVKGDAPTHPALLEWLASEFVNQGWSMKQLHRLIMTSNTFRQSSHYDELCGKVDPADRLLWRFPRRRLEGEIIRDSGLEVSGLLNTEMGGPSIFPELPAGMAVRGGWKTTADEAERDRRSIYVFAKRNTRYPMFESFDMPDTHESCPRRNTTTSPIQALTLLNSPLTLKWAEAFATRIVRVAGTNMASEIASAYRMAFSRAPDAGERTTVQTWFDKHRAIIAQRVARHESLASPAGLPKDFDPVKAAALVDFCHMLINANEFVYLN